MDNVQQITIKNLDSDPISSTMLEALTVALQNDPNVCDINTVHCKVENAKCDLTSALMFMVMGVIAPGIIYDALKAIIKTIFTRCPHPEGYEWYLTLDAESLSVRQENGVVVIRVIPNHETREKE